MTTIKLYHKHKAGEISKGAFLYEVRKDANLPWITNVTSYDDAVKILKNKGVISEAEMPTNEAKGSNNDNVAINARAYRDQMKKKAAEKEAPKSDKNKAKIDALLKQKKEIEKEMENDPEVEKEGGKKADEYGDKLDKIDAQIKKLRQLNEAAGDVDTKGIYDIKMRNGEVIAKGVKFFPNGEWYQETETGGIKLGGKIPDGASVTRVGETLNEVDNNVPTDPAVDRVNPYFLKKGVMKLLAKEKELTNDSYINALNKAAKQLLANPHAFDEDMFANAKEVEKADSKLETQEVKKNNHVDKANEMKKVKVKALKESTIDELIGYLKKKELVNEDMHHEFHVGSEVHTPNGPGKVVEIVGSTLTVEREDGVLEDVQINSARHFTQKAQEEPSTEFAQDEPAAQEPEQSVAGMWKNWKGKPFSGIVNYPSEIDLAKIKQYMEVYGHDKEKMKKLKEAVKKLKEGIKKNPVTGMAVSTATKQDDSLATKLGYTQTIPGNLTPLGKI